MKRTYLIALVTLLAACGSSTDVVRPVRYNFAVIDGRNQTSTAGSGQLAQPITSQLARDPNGKFASGIFNWLAPAIAYAQTLTVPGTPVANAIVCGRESAAGEPQVIPLCAFTLADGKAANSVQPGTKSGTYNILFTAQVPSQQPVQDSTTVTVQSGPMASHIFLRGNGFGCWVTFPPENVLDKYGNAVPYRFTTTGTLAHVGSIVFGDVQARTFIADRQSATNETQSVNVETAGGIIATGKLSVPNLSAACIDLSF